VVLLIGCNPVFAGWVELLPNRGKEVSLLPWLFDVPTGVSPCPPRRVGEVGVSPLNRVVPDPDGEPSLPGPWPSLPAPPVPEGGVVVVVPPDRTKSRTWFFSNDC
jgi:hypothetical protein